MDENKSPRFVGVDVSKEKLDICILPEKTVWQIENNGDFKGLIEKLNSYSPTLVVLEPTGGYEKAVLKALMEAGIPVSREHALRIHHHAKSRGKRCKTDPVDAETIAHYAQCYADQIQPLKSFDKSKETLQQLLRRRMDLVRLSTMEKNRLQNPGLSQTVKDSCRTILKALEAEIKNLETQITELLSQDEVLQKNKALLTSVPGLGEVSANLLLIDLPELGKENHKTIAALVGVLPYTRQSGQYRGKERIGGGRSEIRSVLVMATLSAIRHNTVIAEFYKRLKEKGKKPKVAIIACVRKLLHILNAMIAKQETFKAA